MSNPGTWTADSFPPLSGNEPANLIQTQASLDGSGDLQALTSPAHLQPWIRIDLGSVHGVSAVEVKAWFVDAFKDGLFRLLHDSNFLLQGGRSNAGHARVRTQLIII